MFEAYYSVAVSAQASNTEACIEFVKLLLSDDIQESMALNENVVLNRDAFRKGGEAAVEYFNGPAGDRIFGYDHMTGQPIENRIKFSEKDMDNGVILLQRILSNRSVSRNDPVTRVDYLADVLGFEKELVIHLIDLFKDAGILSDEKTAVGKGCILQDHTAVHEELTIRDIRRARI